MSISPPSSASRRDDHSADAEAAADRPREAARPKLLGDRYELGEQLGKGSGATVYAAIDRRFQREVTIKVFDSAVASDPALRARFNQQVAKAARLHHPHIAAVLDAGFTDHQGGGLRPFVVTEPAGRWSLRTLLERRGRLSPARAVKLARQIASALRYAHESGVIHADVKPENVIVDERGQHAKLVDFSLSFVSAQTGAVTRQTIARRAAYLAPEQVRAQPVGPSTDVYGLGVLLYEIIAGRPPFVGETPYATAERRVHEQARPAGIFDPTIPVALERIVGRALEREPQARWRSMEAFDAALARLEPSDLQPIDAASLPGAADPRPGARRPRGAIWSALGPLVPLLGAAAVLLLGLVLIPRLLRNAPPASVSTADKATVPSVIGKPLAEAQTLARERGLELVVAGDRQTDRVARDVILEQEPVGGWKLDSGQLVRVVVSKGMNVPDVRGRSLENAQASLQDLGWKVARVERASHPGHPAGTVVMQHPPPDEVAPAPGELLLVVAE